MSETRTLQRNAADPQQVKHAARKARMAEERLLDATRAVMDTVSGRIFVRGLLEKAGVYRSIWDPSAKIHYNAGRQDYGHELMALIVEADDLLFGQMEHEAREYRAREARGMDAAAAAQEQSE